LYDCYRVTSFIQKVRLQRRQLGLQECLFYKVVQWQNQGMVAAFILCLGAEYFLSDMLKKYYNRTAIAKVTANVIGAYIFDSQFHMHDALSVFTR